ncbi:hypothetical protein GQX73_g10306 [Xylaria multiplex]|uniref:WW domain-containing protein n=1 Tax=Xylaria multiplex TaxID=323545 RepID=A0A7C8IPJ9_9PEZI|nr:hypothetical protein GQX73_g10306 [Xylaria multiplex]
MMSLPEGWQSDYDGTRWLFRHEASGAEQYHFPQAGDEYAGFLHDVGTGPVELTPEDSLAIEQQAKRRSISGWENDAKSGTRASGGKREKKKIEEIEEENGIMSATGYYDPMLYLVALNNVSPLGADEGERTAQTTKDTRNAALDITPEATPPNSNSEPILNQLEIQPPSTSLLNTHMVATELPRGSHQIWSPVGYVAELATQETVKCAEELAPVELDATSSAPVSVRTDIAQEPAELPTHRSPVEEKAHSPKPTQTTTQLVDSSSLTSASFAYLPSKPQGNPINRVLSSASIRRKPVSPGVNAVNLGQNKYQPWKPTQGVVDQSPQMHTKASEALPQTSVLQNQNSELGNIDQNNSAGESSVLGDIPNALAPPSAPSKPAHIEPLITDNEAPPVPAVLQPAQRPMKDSLLEAGNQQFIPGAQARHDSISASVADHSLSYAPSVLKPGGSQLSNSLQDSEGSPQPEPPHSSEQTQESVASHRPEHVVHTPSGHNDQPSIMRINASPSPSNHGTILHQEGSSKPAFKPYTPDSGKANSEASISVDGKIPVVAPLSFVKRHSSQSSEVSSITPEIQDSNLHLNKPVPNQSDEISELISDISNSTSQAGSVLVIDTLQQSSVVVPEQPPAVANISKPISVTATPPAQTLAISSPANAGITTTQGRPNAQDTHNPSPPIQGPSASLPLQTANPGKVSMSPGPLGPQGNTSNPLPSQTPVVVSPCHKPSQASNIPHTNQAHGLGVHSNHANNTIQRPSHALQANMTTSNANATAQIPTTAPVQQIPYQPQGQSIASPNPIPKPPTVGNPPANTQKPNFQHPATAGPSSYQPIARPPVGNQVLGSGTAQVSSHPSPVMHTVSPIQSQVSSPAQSIASLHISQSSTPVNTFATINTATNTNGGPNVNINQTTSAPVRPPSIPVHTSTQPVENTKPPGSSQASAAGILQAQSVPMANQPVKPYPMLPGQVTPLPSQIGSPPVPTPVSQSIPNNHTKPTANTQHAAVGQQLTQTQTGGSMGYHTIPGQTNPTMNSSQAYGPASSQAQMKPLQQSAPPPHPGVAHAGAHQPSVHQPQPQQMASYPSSIASGQPHSPQMTVPHSVGSSPVAGQPTYAPPPVTPTIGPQGKPFNSAQANAAFKVAGKGVSKWAKKMWNNNTVKQTAAAVGGAVLAESVGMNGGVGAQLAGNLYGSVNRPPLTHAQTAPPQAHGIPGATPQYQPAQIGQQQQPVKIQPLQVQQHHQLGKPQPGYTHPSSFQRPPLSQPQLSQPPLSQPQLSQPQLSQPQLSQPQLSQPQLSQPQLSQPPFSQPTYQPVGIQTPGRPPVAYNQNPALAQQLAAININAQAQAQASIAQAQANLYQQQQYPLVRPFMVSNAPPSAMMNPVVPNAQPQEQAGIDANTAATAAMMIGSAVGAALRPNNSQPQHAYGNTQGYAPQDHASQAGSNGAENHGYPAGNHAGGI